MSSDISAGLAQGVATARPPRHFLCVALVIAGIANAVVPAVFFAGTHLFGQTDLRYRMIVALIVLVEYAIAFLLLLLHANVGFSGSDISLHSAPPVAPGRWTFAAPDAGSAWRTPNLRDSAIPRTTFQSCENRMNDELKSPSHLAVAMSRPIVSLHGSGRLCPERERRNARAG